MPVKTCGAKTASDQDDMALPTRSRDAPGSLPGILLALTCSKEIRRQFNMWLPIVANGKQKKAARGCEQQQRYD